MLCNEAKRHLAKAMALARGVGHELLVLDFNRDPQEEEPPVEVICSMQDSTPEGVAALAKEALYFFAEPKSHLIVN